MCCSTYNVQANVVAKSLLYIFELLVGSVSASGTGLQKWLPLPLGRDGVPWQCCLSQSRLALLHHRPQVYVLVFHGLQILLVLAFGYAIKFGFVVVRGSVVYVCQTVSTGL